jgi:hypothetical protein
MEIQLIPGELNKLQDILRHAYCDHFPLTPLHGAKKRQKLVPQGPVSPEISLMVYDNNKMHTLVNTVLVFVFNSKGAGISESV